VGGGDDHLTLAPDAVAPTFAAAPSATRLAAEWRAGTLRLGRCLPGWTPGVDAFGEWVDAYRARQEAAARTVLAAVLRERAGDDASDPGTPPASVVARALLELDPSHRGAARVLGTSTGASPTDAPTIDLPLVGRGALLGGLVARVREALEGRGGAVWLDGAPGHGASRLLAESAAAAERLGAAVVRVAAGAGGPHDVARVAAARLLDLPGALAAAPATLAALRHFARDADAAPRAAPAAERLLGARLRELLAAVAGERCVVIAVDGVRPPDVPSVGLLAGAAAGGAAALVLWTGAGGDRTAGEWAAGAERRPVPPLAPDEAAALARAAAAAARGTLSDGDAAWCAAAGGGAPRDVIAFARHCAALPGARSAPPSVAARHAAAVAALPRAARRALAAAALLGAHATGDRVARAAAGRGGGAGRGAVALLRRAGVPAEGLPAAGRAALVASAALAGLDAPARVALQRAVAGVLDDDARSALDRGRPASSLVEAAAAHWRAADEAGRATDLLTHARGVLLAGGRAAEAAALLGRAAAGAAAGDEAAGDGGREPSGPRSSPCSRPTRCSRPVTRAAPRRSPTPPRARRAGRPRRASAPSCWRSRARGARAGRGGRCSRAPGASPPTRAPARRPGSRRSPSPRRWPTTAPPARSPAPSPTSARRSTRSSTVPTPTRRSRSGRR
jgi:hypothetical protein